MAIFIYIITLFFLFYTTKCTDITDFNSVNQTYNCTINEGHICIDSTYVKLNQGLNPGSYLILSCPINFVEEQNLNPLIQIQGYTQDNVTSVIYNINTNYASILDLHWSLTYSTGLYPDNLVFGLGDTIHFAIGLDTNTYSSIVVNSQFVVKLPFKQTQPLVAFKVTKIEFCTWRYEMTLTIPSTNTMIADILTEITQSIENHTDHIIHQAQDKYNHLENLNMNKTQTNNSTDINSKSIKLKQLKKTVDIEYSGKVDQNSN
ncbi:hypothetical protein ACR3K2_32370 [Cryptosporidium serpentis]